MVDLFDEPTIDLHPHNVKKLVEVLDYLTTHGATVIVIEHDRDLIHNADWVIDMGLHGGAEGGQIVKVGTPEECLPAED